MEVSGVRSACVTASSSAVRSFLRLAGGFRLPHLLDSASVLHGDGDQRGDGFQRLPRKHGAGNSQAANRVHSHAHGQKADAIGGVNHGLVPRQNRFQGFGIELRHHGTRAINFLLVGQKQRGRADFECSHDLFGDAVDQFHHVAGFEQALAERIQFFDVALASRSVRGLLARARWKDGSKSPRRPGRQITPPSFPDRRP